jgi:hypothetical protein
MDWCSPGAAPGNQHNRKSVFETIPAGTEAVFGPPHAANLVPTCSENLHGKFVAGRSK